MKTHENHINHMKTIQNHTKCNILGNMSMFVAPFLRKRGRLYIHVKGHIRNPIQIRSGQLRIQKRTQIAPARP